MIRWNAIHGHTWASDEMYNRGIRVLKRDPNALEGLTEDSKRSFKARMRYYSLNDNGTRIQYVTEDYPDWMSYAQNNGPMVFDVVKPSEVDAVIGSFFKDTMFTAANYKSLYDKIVRSKKLGISRSAVVDYLKRNPAELVQMHHVGGKPYVKSYRPNFPFEHWQLDHIDFTRLEQGKKQTNKGYKYVLVLIDIFSKYLYIFPSKTNSMDETIRIVQKVFLSGDIPMRLGGDDAFNNDQFVGFCKRFGVQFVAGNPYSPQTQGFVENKNKQIKSLLAQHFAKHERYTFFDMLDRVAFTINNTKHSVTRMTPFLLHRGREINVTPDEAVENGADVLIGAMQQYQDDGCGATKQVAESYRNTAMAIHDARVSHAKTLIHKAADARERKMNNLQLPRLEQGQRVYVAAYRDLDSEVQPVILRLVSENNETVQLETPLYYFSKRDPVLSDATKKVRPQTTKRFPKTMFPKMLLKTARYAWKLPVKKFEQYFEVRDVEQEPRVRVQYKVGVMDLKGNMWKLEILVKAPSEYVDVIPRELLLDAGDKTDSIQTRPDPMFIDLVDRSIPEDQQTQQQPTQQQPKQQKPKPQQPAEDVETLHTQALAMYKNEVAKLQKRKGSKTKLTNILVRHTWVYDVGGVKTYAYAPELGRIVRWSRAQNQVESGKQWDVKFADLAGTVKLALDHVNGYTTSHSNLKEGQWHFVEPKKVIKALAS